MSKDRIKRVRWVRRTVQGACLLLFVWLLLAARFSKTGGPNPLLAFFFDLDHRRIVGTD